MVYYYYYCSLNLVNSTSGYVTLNSSSNAMGSLFLSDSSYSLAPAANQLIVNKSPNSGSVTYNITQNALLKLTWTFNDGNYICYAVVEGSTEYTATGYDDPVVTNDGHSYYTTFTITLSPTTS